MHVVPGAFAPKVELVEVPGDGGGVAIVEKKVLLGINGLNFRVDGVVGVSHVGRAEDFWMVGRDRAFRYHVLERGVDRCRVGPRRSCGRERERTESDIPLLARDTDNDSARTLVARPNVR